jgi:hypothetical protein
MIVASLVSLMTSIGYGYYMRHRWHRLGESIDIIEVSCFSLMYV